MGDADFTTVELWTRSGLTTYCFLVMMKLSTRRNEISDITPNPNTEWIELIGRNLTDYCDRFLNDTKYLLLDRDKKCLSLCGVLESTDTGVILLPPRGPNLNAFIERYSRTMKDECLNKMILFGEKSPRRALSEFEEYYHIEPNHQGIGNNIIDSKGEAGSAIGSVRRRERLGAMLSYY